MKKLHLPDVTLVCVETREHRLAAMAIEDCRKVADFGDVLVLTDKPTEFPRIGVRIHEVPDWPNKLGWSRSWWYDVPPLLTTPYTLNIQWDSWIWDVSMWRDEFYQYDYIGAPWWYKDGKNVGNGGFSFVSTRLKRFLHSRRGQFPCNTNIDDDLLCRSYRVKLMEHGFTWAPEHVAHDFAFECCRPSKDSRHFGFHAMFNWPFVLSREALMERLRIAVESKYIAQSYIMKAFCERHPDIVRELVAASGHQELLTRGTTNA